MSGVMLPFGRWFRSTGRATSRRSCCRILWMRTDTPSSRSAPITLDVSLAEHQPFNFQNIILEADTDGDGVPEPLAAIGVQSLRARRGDLNCDGTVNFSDINPFVLYLSNSSAWQTRYPGCLPENGDINGDGTFPGFTDINPFVALLSGGG